MFVSSIQRGFAPVRGVRMAHFADAGKGCVVVSKFTVAGEFNFISTKLRLGFVRYISRVNTCPDEFPVIGSICTVLFLGVLIMADAAFNGPVTVFVA